jgi:hypothetical protein
VLAQVAESQVGHGLARLPRGTADVGYQHHLRQLLMHLFHHRQNRQNPLPQFELQNLKNHRHRHQRRLLN